ncbi:hypothetical protein ABTX15_07265 [Micromonospora sp. NPDC094482]|uniref:hypothetical protein n=1 Tax=unclassified Micromonospora TaxID=2617518 RepID=UPI00331938A6
MNKISLAVLAVVAMVLAAAAPAAADTPEASIVIDHRASELYPFEPPGGAPGEAYPATSVNAAALHCPAGDYLMSASLVQDGLPTLWAVWGHGAGEVRCDGGTVMLSMAFSRREPLLHPGRATVRFSLRDASTSEQLAEGTRTVRIPN